MQTKLYKKYISVLNNIMSINALKHVFPYLHWSDRINLNMSLPKSSRIYNKFNRVDLLTHDFRCIISTIKTRLYLIEDTFNNTTKRCFLCKELFVILVRPRYRYFIQVNHDFRLSVLAKLNEFTNGANLFKTSNIPKEDAMEMGRVARTVRKILLEKPAKNNTDSQFIHNTKEDWHIIA